MIEKRTEYIDRLLHELKALESRVLAMKNENSVPFSFFRESFDKTQSVMRLLHEMETLQIEDMKCQMERLVSFLSESGNQSKEETASSIVSPVVETTPETMDNVKIELHHSEPKEISLPNEFVDEPIVANEVPVTPTNPHAGKIILPEYKNPRKTEATPPPSPATVSPQPNPIVEPMVEPAPKTMPEVIVNPIIEEMVEEEKNIVRSLNDAIKAPHSMLDLKRSISINDRFLFKRELFNNDQTQMDSMMSKLNSFTNYNDAERFLRETTSWNFDNQAVVDFLDTIQKGYQ